MALSPSRRAAAVVLVVLVALFAGAELLSRAYRAARRERAESHFKRGRALAAQKRYPEAVEQYRAALSFARDHPEYRLALALALMESHEWQEAEGHLNELRESDPTSGVVNLMLARVYANTGRREAAEAAYHRAIFGYWPRDAQRSRMEARFELIELFLKYADRKQAIAELLQAAAEAPDDPQVKVRAARLLLKSGSPANAVTVFREAAAMEGSGAEPWIGLAEAERAMGGYREAVLALRTAQRRAPGDTRASRLLAETREAIELDPSGARLPASERYRRSLELAKRALAALERCAPPDPATAELEQSAKASLAAASPRRRREGDTENAIALAESLWEARQRACRDVPESDLPLALAMAKVTG